MQWVASTLHTTSEHGVSSITTADAHTSAASSRLNWRPLADLNGFVLFARKTKSSFCACAITFQTQSTVYYTASRLSNCFISLCISVKGAYCFVCHTLCRKAFAMLSRVLIQPNSHQKNDDDRDPRTYYLLTIQEQSYQITIKKHVPRFKHYSHVTLLLCLQRRTNQTRINPLHDQNVHVYLRSYMPE